MGTFRDNFGNEYMDPYIPQKIVGFIGIDPDIVSGSGDGSGSGGGGGTDDHEQLQNLLGGDRGGHYHLTVDEWHYLTQHLDEEHLNDYIDARIAAYMASQSSGG